MQSNQPNRGLGDTLVTLRSDLSVVPNFDEESPKYIIEDPLNLAFYEVGPLEYGFLSALDGKTTVSQAIELACRSAPELRLTEQEAGSICQWLINNDLAYVAEFSNAEQLVTRMERSEQQKRWALLNILFMRVPLWHPDRFLAALRPWLGWVQHPVALFVTGIMAIIAGGMVLQDWDRVVSSSSSVFLPSSWLWLTACWLTLKLIHELAHGVVCRIYGGSVREAGVVFVLFGPLPYIDVTSSWRLRSKWQRIHIAAAGMISELQIASIAAVCWCHTEPGVVNFVSFNIMVAASLVTVLFNANPLMRFDGYYILSDLLRIPNLSALGQQSLQQFARKMLFGLPTLKPIRTGIQGWVVATYGVAAFFWRILVMISITIAAALLFQGAGVILAALSVALWLVPAICRFSLFVIRSGELAWWHRLRFLVVTGTMVSGVALITWIVPWPGATTAPAIVDYSPSTIVRTQSAGFVKKVFVRNGQSVKKGQLIAVLENEQLQVGLADLNLALQQSEQRARSLSKRGSLALHQGELARHLSLHKQLAEKRAEVDGLKVLAPHDGRIVGRTLTQALGTYLKKGDAMVAIGIEGSKEIQLAIAQSNLTPFTQRVGTDVSIRLPTGTFLAPLDKIDPRGSLSLHHPSLSASNGGRLAVQQSGVGDDASRKQLTYELLEPHFIGYATMTEEQSQQLWVGQRGLVRIQDHDRSIGRYLYEAIGQWITQKISARPSR